MNKRGYLLFISTVFLFDYTSAQTTSDSITLNIDEVVIEGARIDGLAQEENSNIQIITRKQIEQLPAETINEILTYANGVDLKQRGPKGAQADITIDGSTFDQVLVLVNGVKMSDPQTGHHMMNLPVPVEAIDHIEIIRGAAGRKYGVNALAGVVNIVTKIPDENQIFAGAFSGSSFKKDTSSGDTYYNFGSYVGGVLRTEKYAHLITVSYDKSNGYRYNTGFENYKVYYQNEINLGTHNIETNGAYVNNEFGANAFYAAPGDAESKETVQTAFVSVHDNWFISDKIKIRPGFGYRYGKDDYIYIRQKPSVFRNLHETNVVNADLNVTYTNGAHVIGIGTEYRNENIRSTNLGFNTRDYVGMFAEYKLNMNNFTAGVGLYGSYNSVWGFELFPGADVGYSVSPAVKLFANFESGQRIPTYTDLYYDGPSNIGNADLIPEKGFSTQGGLKFKHGGLGLETSVSFKDISEFIDYTRIDSTFEWQPQNYQSIQTTVFNVKLDYNFGNDFGWDSKHNIILSSGYSYLEPSVENNNSLESKYAIESLRHQWISILNFIHGNLTLTGSSKYQFRINGNDYTIIDVRVGYKIRKFAFFLDINNVLDTQYSEIASVPLPGIWSSFGIKFNTK